MSKPIVIIADLDENYLAPLEMKFIEELNDKMDLEIITERKYFNEYFSKPRTIEILIISEDLYKSEIQKHNIANIFVLSEHLDSGDTDNLSINKIFKYSSLKEIFNEILYKSKSEIISEKKLDKETQIVMVYSAGGGTGKTTVSLGLSASLSQNYKKVLYVNAEYIQNFHIFLKNKAPISNENVRYFNKKNEKIYQDLKYDLRNELFDYLPPFPAAISSLNIKYSAYCNFIKMVKASNEYDYIILDADSSFNDEKAELLSLSDKVFIIVNSDSYSIFKTETLLDNIECNDNDKYCFICNYLKNNVSDVKSEFKITEYIDFINDYEGMTVERLKSMEVFQRLAYMLL